MQHVPVGFTCDEEKQSWCWTNTFSKKSKEQDIGMG